MDFFTFDVSMVASTWSALVGSLAEVSPPVAELSPPHDVSTVANARPAPSTASNRLLLLIHVSLSCESSGDYARAKSRQGAARRSIHRIPCTSPTEMTASSSKVAYIIGEPH